MNAANVCLPTSWQSPSWEAGAYYELVLLLIWRRRDDGWLLASFTFNLISFSRLPNEIYVPHCETYVPRRGTYIPHCGTYVPRRGIQILVRCGDNFIVVQEEVLRAL